MLKGYRTIVFNVLMGALLLWRTYAPGDEMPTEDQVSTLVDALFNSLDAITVVGNIVLRKFTDTPLGRQY